jgi:hypothetical protein
MTNRELIEQLKKFPPESTPFVSVPIKDNPFGYSRVLEVLGASAGDDESVTFIDAE